MKDKNELYAIFALTLALDIPLLESFLQFAFTSDLGAEPDERHRLTVSSESELRLALSDPDITYLSLTTDIVLYENLVFARKLTLDLNGYKIASLTPNARVIDVVSGDLIITGKGSIVANGDNAAAVRIKGAMTSDTMSYSSVLIDEDVTLYAPNYYGLFVTPNYNSAYGVEVDFRGSMIARDGFCINGNIKGHGRNTPLINIADGARITVDENDGIAIYASGYGRWRIGAAEIIGATGLGVRTGQFELKKTSIIATGIALPLTDWSDGMTSLGAAIEIDTTHDEPIDLTIRGGEYLSHQGYTLVEGGIVHIANPTQTVKILSGNFSGAAGIFQGVAPHGSSNSLVSISGGNFSGNIAEYLSPSHRSEYDRSMRTYRVFDVVEGLADPSPAQLLSRAKSRLESILMTSEHYLSSSYASQELGDLQSDVDKALASIRRAKKAAEKLLMNSRTATVDQIENMIRRVNRANSALQKIEDELRTDILSAIASARAIDPHDFSRYSYQILMNSVQDADILLIQKQVSLIGLYSAFCDINMNLDLLDEPEEDGDVFSPVDDLTSSAVSTILPPAPAVMPTVSAPLAPAPAPSLPNPLPSAPSEPPLVEDIESEVQSAEDLLTTTAILGAFALAETPLINEQLIPARENLRALINALTILNPSDYTLDSYRKLHELIIASTELLSEPDENLSSDLLISTYNEVNLAYDNLVKKSSDPVARTFDEACQNLYAILEVVSNLSLSDYDPNSAEQFGELQVAIAKARVNLQNPSITLPEIINTMDEIQRTTTGLRGASSPKPQPEPVTVVPPVTAAATIDIAQPSPSLQPQPTAQPPISQPTPISQPVTQPDPQPAPSPAPEPVEPPAPTIDWSPLQDIITDIAALNPADYTSESYQHLMQQLEYTRNLASDPRLTQDVVEDIVFELNLSVLSLEHLQPEPSVYENALSHAAQPIAEASVSPLPSNDTDVAPNLLMSMMAGAYAGIATYRRSRIAAKQRK